MIYSVKFIIKILDMVEDALIIFMMYERIESINISIGGYGEKTKSISGYECLFSSF